MSFILEALKKSEADRQRQATPGFIEVSPIIPRPRFPLWAIGLGLLLGVVLTVLIVLVTRQERATATAPAQALAPPAIPPIPGATPAAASASQAFANPPAAAGASGGTANSPRAAANFSPMDAPVYAPEIPVPQQARPRSHVEPARTAAKSVSSSTPQAAHDNEETLPTVDEMNLAGQHGIPEMHLDIHVFDANPANRFVFINMRKYREGAALQEGPTVERIIRAGVVLNYQGLRFILPRQ